MSTPESKPVGPRLAGLLFVGLLHVALIYALMQGLARQIVEVVRNPLEVKIVETVKPPPEQPPPLPTPKLAAPPPPYIPPPEVRVQVPQPQAPITVVTPVKPAELAPAPAAPGPAAPAQGQGVAPKPHVPVRVPAVVDARACEKPRYPPASLRANETGTVLVSFLIDVNGVVLESKVERSSGYRRLDEAARSGLALCRFRPATVDGKPEQSWARLEYEWKIVD
jgi:protein TonB